MQGSWETVVPGLGQTKFEGLIEVGGGVKGQTLLLPQGVWSNSFSTSYTQQHIGDI